VEKNALATRLKAIREGKGLTKYRLAKLSKISQTYIYRLELGEIKNPRRDTLQSLAKGLGITLAQLIGETAPVETWQLVEQSLKAYIPVYAGLGEGMEPIDYVVCSRTELPPPTMRAYRADGLCREPEILSTDTIIVDTAISPRNGDFVVAVVKGEAKVGHYRQEGKSKWFEYSQGRCDAKDISIHGVITDLHRRMRN
jgi:transcriptional regulator with XRE-family HTH domain